MTRLVAAGLTTDRLNSGPFHAVLSAGAEKRYVRWLHRVALDAGDPVATVSVLDAHLRQQATELRLRLRPE